MSEKQLKSDATTLGSDEIDAVLHLLDQYQYDGHPWNEDLTRLADKLKETRPANAR